MNGAWKGEVAEETPVLEDGRHEQRWVASRGDAFEKGLPNARVGDQVIYHVESRRRGAVGREVEGAQLSGIGYLTTKHVNSLGVKLGNEVTGLVDRHLGYCSGRVAARKHASHNAGA